MPYAEQWEKLTLKGYVIVSGLPGSGKSTLARRLAPTLDLPLLDKDDVLEALFDSLGVGDADWRRRLSRSADEVLRRLATQMSGAVLASWWRHPKAEGESGTPIEWLSSLPGKLVEVHCVCEPRIAAERFLGRTRHPGHLDNTKNREDLAADFERLATLGPLDVGPVVRASTEGEGSGFDGLVRQILSSGSQPAVRNDSPIQLMDARDTPEDAERRWIENVYPFYLHDLSEFGESIYHLNGGGLWRPDYLPAWFSERGARPLVLRSGNDRIGFAFVGQDPFPYRSFDVDQRLSEFFILRSWRGRGLGLEAALAVFQAFPGVWELFTLRSNRPAQAFWKKVFEKAGTACEPEIAVHSIRYRFHGRDS